VTESAFVEIGSKLGEVWQYFGIGV